MFGASGTFESPSRPWHAWHIRAFVRPAFTSPALHTLPPATRRQTDANRLTASSAALGYAEIILNPQGSRTMEGMMAPRQGAIILDQDVTCRRTRCDRALRPDRPRPAANHRATAPHRRGDPGNSH